MPAIAEQEPRLSTEINTGSFVVQDIGSIYAEKTPPDYAPLVAGATIVGSALDALRKPHSRRANLTMLTFFCGLGLATACVPPPIPYPTKRPETPIRTPEMVPIPVTFNTPAADQVFIEADVPHLALVNRTLMQQMIDEQMEQKLAVDGVTVHLWSADLTYKNPADGEVVGIPESLYRIMAPEQQRNVSDGRTITVFDKTGKITQVDVHIALGRYSQWAKEGTNAQLTRRYLDKQSREKTETLQVDPNLALTSLLFQQLFYHAAGRIPDSKPLDEETAQVEERRGQEKQFELLRAFINRKTTEDDLLIIPEPQSPAEDYDFTKFRETLEKGKLADKQQELRTDEIDQLLEGALALYCLSGMCPHDLATVRKRFNEYKMGLTIKIDESREKHNISAVFDFTGGKQTHLQLSSSSEKVSTQTHAIVLAGLLHFLGKDAGTKTIGSDDLINQLSIPAEARGQDEYFQPIVINGVSILAVGNSTGTPMIFNHLFDNVLRVLLSAEIIEKVRRTKDYGWLKPTVDFITGEPIGVEVKSFVDVAKSADIGPSTLYAIYHHGALGALINGLNPNSDEYTTTLNWLLQFRGTGEVPLNPPNWRKPAQTREKGDKNYFTASLWPPSSADPRVTNGMIDISFQTTSGFAHV